MRNLLRVVALATSLMTMPVSAPLANPADPINGTWELNVDKSTFEPGPEPQSQTRTYESDGHTVKLISKGVNAAGTVTQVQYTARYDGKDYPMTGSPVADTIALKRIDEVTAEATLKKAGRIVSTTTRVISRDGKEMTFTTTGTNERGDTIRNVLVFDKK